ncbi:hypothetical protein F5Y16DRAFT_376803 [Xylariaceae sp. FL0255]|nr:hypothetical protein F5Y16DRAFT_376803 [Xylariaceae sp. FL0255]
MSLSAVIDARRHDQGNRAKFHGEVEEMMPELNENLEFHQEYNDQVQTLEQKLRAADETTTDSRPLTLESPCLEPDLVEPSSDVLLEVFTHYLLQKMREFESFEEFVTGCAPDKAAMQLLVTHFHQEYPVLRIKFPPGTSYQVPFEDLQEELSLFDSSLEFPRALWEIMRQHRKLMKESKKTRRDRLGTYFMRQKIDESGSLENFFQHTNYLNDVLDQSLSVLYTEFNQNLYALEMKHPVDSPAPEKSPEEFWSWLHAEWLRLQREHLSVDDAGSKGCLYHSLDDIGIKSTAIDSAKAANLQVPALNGVKTTQAACRTNPIADISARAVQPKRNRQMYKTWQFKVRGRRQDKSLLRSPRSRSRSAIQRRRRAALAAQGAA